MKRLTIALIIVCGFFALNAQAQTSGPQTLRANIPFSFNVGDKTLPAGVYTVAVVNPASDHRALQIRSADGHASAIIQTTQMRGSLADQAKLMFRRYGDQYFFAQAQLAGEPISLVAARSRAERSTRRTLARTGDSTVVTVVAH